MCIVCTIMDGRIIIKMLEDDGWYLHAQKGSHRQYKHVNKPGKVTVPHPKRDLPIKTIVSIFKQAGIRR